MQEIGDMAAIRDVPGRSIQGKAVSSPPIQPTSRQIAVEAAVSAAKEPERIARDTRATAGNKALSHRRNGQQALLARNIQAS